jgi:hypothetical protein
MRSTVVSLSTPEAAKEEGQPKQSRRGDRDRDLAASDWFTRSDW